MDISGIIAIRVDGNNEIGYGHAMRMLALTEMLSGDYNFVIFTRISNTWIIDQFSKNNNLVYQIPEYLQPNEEIDYICKKKPSLCDLMVLDGYKFDTSYQNAMKLAGFKLLSIDDHHSFHYVADAVINHAGAVEETEISKEPYTKVYIGPSYALLRKEFINAAKMQVRTISSVSNAFVSFGGTDPDIYNNIIQTLLSQNIQNIHVVVNDTSRFPEWLENKKVHLYSNLPPGRIKELMQTCEIAILPPSTLAYEYCSVGGGVFLYQTADNQRNIYNFLIQGHCAIDYSRITEILSSEEITSHLNSCVKNQKIFFNGKSAENISKVIFQILFYDRLKIRSALLKDIDLFYQWANDPDSRQNSFNKEPIAYEDHVKWYNAKLVDKNYKLYVLQANDLLLGCIRFEINNEHALLSYSIDKKFRGKGLGLCVLKKGIQFLREENNSIKKVSGYVHNKNKASEISFSKVGFELDNAPPKSFKDYSYYSISF